MDDIDIKNAISDVINELRIQTRVLNAMLPTSSGKPDGSLETATKQHTDATVSNTKVQHSQTNAIKSNIKEIKEETRAKKGLNATFDILADTVDGVDNSFRRLQHGVAGTAIQFSRSFSGMLDSIVSGQQSFHNYSHVAGNFIKILSDGSSLLIRSINPLNRWWLTASRLVEGFGSLLVNITQRSMRMQDMLLDSYREIAKSGGAASDGLSGINDSLGRMRLSVDDFSVLNSIISSSRQEFAMMSGTVFTGRKRFADISQVLMQQREQFELLGLTVPEVNESLASYIRLQTRLGNSQVSTNLELAQGAARYIKEMDALSKVTGIQRNELESEMERARSEEIFRAKLNQLTASDQGDMARNLQLVNAVISKEAPELAQGFRDIQSGIPPTRAAEQFLLATQHRGIGIIENMLSGNVGVAETLQELGRAVRGTVDAYGPHLASVGKFGEIFGNYAQLSNFVLITGENFTEMLQQAIAEQQTQSRGEDTELRKRLARERSIRNAQIEFNRVIREVTLPALDFFNMAIGKIADSIVKVVNFLSRYIPGISPITENVPDLGSIESNLSGSQQTTNNASGRTMARPQSPTQRPSTSSAIASNRSRENLQDMIARQGEERGRTAATSTNPLLDLIGKAEARTHGYDALVYRTNRQGRRVSGGSADLQNMTLDQIFEFQSRMRAAGHASTAVGRYQFKNDTLRETAQALGLDTATTLFSAETQDKLATKLIQQTRRQSRDDADFAHRLAGRWAALKTQSGVGRHDGVVGNRATVEYQSVIDAIQASGFKNGGISMGPNSGYFQLLHGTEAIVPLPDGNKIPVDIRGPNDSYAAMNFSTPEETEKLNEQKKLNTGLGGLDALMREHIDISKHQRNILSDLIDQTRKNTSAIEQLIRVTVN